MSLPFLRSASQGLASGDSSNGGDSPRNSQHQAGGDYSPTKLSRSASSTASNLFFSQSPRSLSKRLGSILSVSSREPLALEEESDEMRAVDALMKEGREERNELAGLGLAGYSPEVSLKIRFLTAYNEWVQLTNKRDKAVKARKIVDVFFTSTSPFRLKNIPAALEQDLQMGRYESFLSARVLALAEIAQDASVLAHLADLASSEGSHE